MSKQKAKKKRRVYSHEETAEAKKALKESVKQFRWKLALLMLGIFLVLALVYYILLRLQVIWASPVLYSAAAVLFLTFFFVNRGFSREPVAREILPDDWPEARKDSFIEEDIRRKAFARKLMIPLVPVLLLVCADMILLLIVPLFRA